MTPSTKNTQPALLKLLVVALTIVALVLLGFLQAARSDIHSKVLEAGDHRPISTLYAVGHNVELPGATVTVAVAPPVRELDAGIVEDDVSDAPSDPRQSLDRWKAPEGGRLVPVTWRVRLTSSSDSPKPIKIRLVADDQRIDVTSTDLLSSEQSSDAVTGVSTVYSMHGDLELSDLRVEVEYDGVTQVVDPTTGDIDTGIAQPLYEEARTFDTGCQTTDDNCEFRATDPDAQIHPTHAGFQLTDLVLSPYDSKLGWADEGKLWASTEILSFGGMGQDDAGTYYPQERHGPLRARLDGEKPTQLRDQRRAERRAMGRDEIASGTLVFSVDADDTPKELAIRSSYKLSNGTRLPITTTVELQGR